MARGGDDRATKEFGATRSVAARGRCLAAVSPKLAREGRIVRVVTDVEAARDARHAAKPPPACPGMQQGAKNCPSR